MTFHDTEMITHEPSMNHIENPMTNMNLMKHYDTAHDTAYDTAYDTAHDTAYDTAHDTAYDTAYDIGMNLRTHHESMNKPSSPRAAPGAVPFGPAKEAFKASGGAATPSSPLKQPGRWDDQREQGARGTD